MGHLRQCHWPPGENILGVARRRGSLLSDALNGAQNQKSGLSAVGIAGCL